MLYFVFGKKIEQVRYKFSNFTSQSTGAYGCVTVLQKHGSTKGMSPIGSPCMFPFIYKGQTWKQCISDGSRSSLHWCSTQVFYSASIMCSKIENAFPKRIIHYSPLFRLMVPVIMFLASGVTAALRVLYKNLNLPLHCNLPLNLHHLYLHLYRHLHQVTRISNYNKISVTVTINFF